MLTTNAELLTVNSGDLYALGGGQASLMAVAVFEEVSQGQRKSRDQTELRDKEARELMWLVVVSFLYPRTSCTLVVRSCLNKHVEFKKKKKEVCCSPYVPNHLTNAHKDITVGTQLHLKTPQHFYQPTNKTTIATQVGRSVLRSSCIVAL